MSLSQRLNREYDIYNSDSIINFVDSLRFKILQDTVLYKRSDLINLNGCTVNSKSYSFLYVLNGRYYYRLDIIDGFEVQQFVDEFLTSSKISHVFVLNPKKAQEVYGSKAEHGAILIYTKYDKQVNYFVAGLKKGRYNCNQARRGDVRIRNR